MLIYKLIRNRVNYNEGQAFGARFNCNAFNCNAFHMPRRVMCGQRQAFIAFTEFISI